MKLTQRKIEGIKCPAGKKDVLLFDDQQRGLAVRVAAAGEEELSRAIHSRRRKRRVPARLVLGHFARRREGGGRQILGDVAQGRDPAAARKEAAREAKRKAEHEALTLAALIEQWEDIRLADKRERYAREAVRALRFAFASI